MLAFEGGTVEVGRGERSRQWRRGQHCVTCPLGADISSAVSRGQSGCTLLTSAIPGIPFRACSGRGNLQMEEVVSLQNERRRKQVGFIFEAVV